MRSVKTRWASAAATELPSENGMMMLTRLD
jgi:hypothetical protein